MGDIADFDPQGEDYLNRLEEIASEDVAGLKKAQASYGNSWKSRGGVGAFMMLARKWDRLENRLKRVIPGSPVKGEMPGAGRYDIFDHVLADPRAEGVIDDIRDLRRYLLLVEGDLRARGFGATHRDNAPEEAEEPAPALEPLLLTNPILPDWIELNASVYTTEGRTHPGVPGSLKGRKGKVIKIVGNAITVEYVIVVDAATTAQTFRVQQDFKPEELQPYRETRAMMPDVFRTTQVDHPAPFGYDPAQD